MTVYLKKQGTIPHLIIMCIMKKANFMKIRPGHLALGVLFQRYGDVRVSFRF